MWNKISNGWVLAGSSWQLLCQDKKLIVFPLISGTCCFLVIVAFCVPFLADPTLLNFPQDAQGTRRCRSGSIRCCSPSILSTTS